MKRIPPSIMKQSLFLKAWIVKCLWVQYRVENGSVTDSPQWSWYNQSIRRCLLYCPNNAVAICIRFVGLKTITSFQTDAFSVIGFNKKETLILCVSFWLVIAFLSGL